MAIGLTNGHIRPKSNDLCPQKLIFFCQWCQTTTYHTYKIIRVSDYIEMYVNHIYLRKITYRLMSKYAPEGLKELD